MEKAVWYDNLLDPEQEQRAFLEAVYPLLERMFLDFAALAMAPLGGDFDPFDAAAQEWVQAHAFEFVQGVTATTIDQLRRTLVEGWEAGEGIPELAARVRDVFEQADRYRSFLIARTETTATANMAQLSVLRQAGIGYKTWSTSHDERVCPVCRPLDGKTVRLDEEFGPGIFAPPAHPGCRCTTLAATELDEIEVTKYPGQPRDRQGRFASGSQPNPGPSVYPVGKIDRSRVASIAEVDRDDVGITVKRARHIMDRHPGMLEKYGPSVPMVLATPDVIAIKPGERQMAHYLKRNVLGEGIDLEIVVWLHTKADGPGLPNVVVTLFETDINHRLPRLQVVYTAPGA